MQTYYWRPDDVTRTGVVQPAWPPGGSPGPVDMARHTIDPFIAAFRPVSPAVTTLPSKGSGALGIPHAVLPTADRRQNVETRSYYRVATNEWPYLEAYKVMTADRRLAPPATPPPRSASENWGGKAGPVPPTAPPAQAIANAISSVAQEFRKGKAVEIRAQGESAKVAPGQAAPPGLISKIAYAANRVAAGNTVAISTGGQQVVVPGHRPASVTQPAKAKSGQFGVVTVRPTPLTIR
jgi:hypothetical protein